MQGFFEVWGEGATWDELMKSVNAFPEARKQLWLGSNTTMKVSSVETAHPTKGFAYSSGSMQDPAALARGATLWAVPCRGAMHAQLIQWCTPHRRLGSFAGLVHASSRRGACATADALVV